MNDGASRVADESRASVEQLAAATSKAGDVAQSAAAKARAAFASEQKAIDRVTASTRQLTATTKQYEQAFRAAERLRARGITTPFRNGAVFHSEIDDFRTAIERANAPTERHRTLVDRAASSLRDHASALNVNVDGLAKYAARVTGAVVVLAALGGVLVKRGFDQVSALEKAELSITAIIAGSGDIVDANGRILAGQEKINAAQSIAKEQTAQLRMEALDTTATFRDLVSVMQVAQKPALQAGFRLDQIVPFVKRVSQTGSALGIDGSMLPQEIRALLQGEKGPDNQIANALLGDVSKAQFDKLKESGELFDFLMAKMEAFAAASERASMTFAGSMSNFQDAVDAALGEATQGAAGETASMLRVLSAEITHFDEQGRQVFNPDFVEGVRSLSTGLVLLAQTGVLAVENIPRWKKFFSEIRAGFAGGWAGAKIAADKKASDDKKEAQRLAAETADRDEAINRGRTFLTDKRPGRGLGIAGPDETGPGRVVTPARWKADERDREVGEFLRTLDDEVEAIFRAKMAEAQKDGKVTVAEQRGASSASNKPLARFREVLQEYTKDGVMTIADFRNAKSKFETEMARAASDRLHVASNQQEDKGAARLAEQLDEYADVIEKYKTKTDAASDPFSQKLATIATQRADAIDKVEDAQKKFKGSSRNWQADIETVNAYFDDATREVDKDRQEYTAGVRQWLEEFQRGAAANAIDADPIAARIEELNAKRQAAINEFAKKVQGGAQLSPLEVMLGISQINSSFDAEIKAFYRDKVAQPIAQMSRETQREVEADRIELIEDSVERELQQRLNGIDEWFEATKEAHKGEKDFLDALAAERAKREQKVRDDAKRERDRDTVGTREWARRMAEDVRRELGTISQSMTQEIVEARQQLGGLWDGVFDGLIDDTFDAGDQMRSVIEGLGKTWSRTIGDMVKRSIFGGESMVSQIRGVIDSLNQLGQSGLMQGGTAWLDIGLQGAGVGSFIGSMFGDAGNYGAEGGSIGGVIGAIVGTVFGATGVGAVIGSAIGTAIGAAIQKGQDEIKVAITDGVVSVTEKGISAAARHDVEVQVKRRVKDEMKSWQAILDTLPDEMKAQLATIKVPTPRLDLHGGVEAGDISDENALTALNDLLGNKLPKAAFRAYEGSLNAALQVMGVNGKRIEELFTYWGTLQGQELHDAVAAYVSTVLDQAQLHEDLSAPWEKHVQAAKDAAKANDPLEQMRKANAEMATVFASMSKLKDVDDIVAAQQRINDLAREGRQAELAALQQLQAARQTFNDSLANQREQIELSRMSEQEKLDYYFRQSLTLRDEIAGAEDPAEVMRLTQKLQGYLSSALALGGAVDEEADPERAAAIKKVQDQVLAILDDVGGAGNTVFDDREDAIQQQAQKAADTLLLAGETLLKAAGDGSGTPNPTVPSTGGGKPPGKELPILTLKPAEPIGIDVDPPLPPKLPGGPVPQPPPWNPKGLDTTFDRAYSAIDFEKRLPIEANQTDKQLAVSNELRALLQARDGQVVGMSVPGDDINARDLNAHYEQLAAMMRDADKNFSELATSAQAPAAQPQAPSFDTNVLANVIAAAVGKSVAQALQGAVLEVDFDGYIDVNGFVQRSVQATIKTIRDNPTSIKSPTRPGSYD